MSIKKHIPNALTCGNLISGCIATCFAFLGEPATALAWIVAGVAFDFLDGMVARLLGVQSAIGKELDSLADVVTSGVAPSTILLSELLVLNWPEWAEGTRIFDVSLSEILAFSAYVMAAFSALRLAKFNLDLRQTTSFIGLPTPANALFWGAFILGIAPRMESQPWMPWLLLGMMAVSCWLLVSELPMFALKFKHWGWRDNRLRYFFLLTCIPLLALFGISGIALIIVWYVLLSLIVHLKTR